MGKLDANWVVLVVEVFDGVNSMMKFSRTCPLTAVIGLYLMSNSLSSVSHFINLPEVSGLCNTCLIFVRISIVCAWKYGRSLLGMVTEARISFSIFGYLFFASLIAWLH